MNMMQTIDGTYPRNGAPEEFPLTLAACLRRERHETTDQWGIGDALIKECGPPSEPNTNDGSRKKIVAAAEYLAANGLVYACAYLKNLRIVAHRFRPECRQTGISFSACLAAGSPEILNSVMKANPGRKIVEATVREYLSLSEVKAARVAAKRMDKATKRTKAPEPRAPNTTQPYRGFNGLERGDEIAPHFGAEHGRALVARLVKDRGSKEVWSLILQAKDNGFLNKLGMETKLPTIRLLFPDAPLGWAKNYMLTDAKDRTYIRDELMPAAVANKDAIIAEPEKIEIILREHFERQKTVAKKVVEEKKLTVAREVTEHDDVILFGKRYWPIVDKTQFDYDFEQLAAAYWTFNEIYCMAGANGTSPGACAHGIRFTIGRIQQYVTLQDRDSPVRTNMRRMLNVVIDLANALEKNPDGECIRPPLPR